jgi:hypothetical protein
MNLQTEQQARQHLFDLVAYLKKELSIQTPPRYRGVNDPIAAHLKLTVREAELDFDEGQYYPDKQLIVLDPRVSDPDRINFTFFHEITHHLIREDGPLYSFLNEYAQSTRDFKIALETYCNIGAAEFILPSNDMRGIIANQGFSIILVEQLENIYPASKPAIAIQMAQCASHECFIVVCEYGVVPAKHTLYQSTNFLNQHSKSTEQLFVQYSASSPSLKKYSIGRYTVISQDHIIGLAYRNQSHITGVDVIPFRSGTRWTVDCEATFCKGKVYAAFNITTPQIQSVLQHSFLDD